MSGDAVVQHELPDFVRFVWLLVAVAKKADLEDSAVEHVWRMVSVQPVKWSLGVDLKVDSVEDAATSCCADCEERHWVYCVGVVMALLTSEVKKAVVAVAAAVDLKRLETVV